MFEALGERLAAALKKISGRGVLRPEDVDAGLREVRLALLEADVNFKVVKEFVERVRARLAGVEISPGLTAPQTVVKAVSGELVELLGGNAEGLRYASLPPTVLMLVGLQGSGKTTTAVKLALLARRDGHRPLVAGLDFRRPAAVEQLKILAETEKVAFGRGEEAIAEAARLNCDVVILDTAGRLHVDGELMDELEQLKSRVKVTETLLVADSMTGQEAVKVGEAFGRAVGVDGVILTKLDGDARGGAALSFRVATGERIRFAGTGEKPADLEVFHAERMARGRKASPRRSAQLRRLPLPDPAAARHGLARVHARDGSGRRRAQGPARRSGHGKRDEENGGDHPVDDAPRAGSPRAHRRRAQAPDRPRQRRAARRHQPAA